MPAADTVAKLNQIGRKDKPAPDTRFRARISDVFSPEKHSLPLSSRRGSFIQASSKLQRRTSSLGESMGARRSSLSLPSERRQQQIPAPKLRNKLGLKRSRIDATGSPLKKHGYDLELKKNPNVDLNDSPAKNTRSKGNTEISLNALSPIARRLVARKARAGRKDVPRRAPTAKPSLNHRKRKAGQEIEQEGNSEEGESQLVGRRNAKRARTEDDNTSGGDGDGSQIEGLYDEEVLSSDQDGESEAEAEESPKKRERPEKSTIIRAQFQENEATQHPKKQKLRDYFGKELTEVIKENNCADSWVTLATAAQNIRHLTAGVAESNEGQNTQKSAVELINNYKAMWKESQFTSDRDEAVYNCLNTLERHCELLKPSKNSQHNMKIFTDMCCIAIPKLCRVLEFFLLARGAGQKMELTGSAELDRLIDLTTTVCRQANSWKPRPVKLEPGILRSVRSGIYPSLKQIRTIFQQEIEYQERMKKDREAIERFSRKQAAALQARSEKLERQRAMKMDSWRRQQQQEQGQPHQQTYRELDHNSLDRVTDEEGIFDLDEIDQHTATLSSKEPPIVDNEILPQVSGGETQRPVLVREPTVDLPPPLSVDLKEKEKMALLNGLQQYVGANRWNEILNDRDLGYVLRKRDLDDLMKAARSFNQMMASKIGADTYRADQSFSWLWSVDPVIDGNST